MRPACTTRPTRHRSTPLLLAVGALLAGGALLVLTPGAALADDSHHEGCEDLLVAYDRSAATGDPRTVALTAQAVEADVAGWELIGWEAAPGTELRAILATGRDGTIRALAVAPTGMTEAVVSVAFCGTAPQAEEAGTEEAAAEATVATDTPDVSATDAGAVVDVSPDEPADDPADDPAGDPADDQPGDQTAGTHDAIDATASDPVGAGTHDAAPAEDTTAPADRAPADTGIAPTADTEVLGVVLIADEPAAPVHADTARVNPSADADGTAGPGTELAAPVAAVAAAPVDGDVLPPHLWLIIALALALTAGAAAVRADALAAPTSPPAASPQPAPLRHPEVDR